MMTGEPWRRFGDRPGGQVYPLPRRENEPLTGGEPTVADLLWLEAISRSSRSEGRRMVTEETA